MPQDPVPQDPVPQDPVPQDHRPTRFVVLHHTAGPSLDRTFESHLDWMFERGNWLMTFATSVIESLDTEVPITGGLIETDARQLPRHRIEYLDREGEISGGRGQVRRVLAGTFECLRAGKNEFVAEISWPGACGPQQAEAAFHRILSDDLRFNVNLDAWRLRLTP